MSQTSNSWVGWWVCITIVVGIITFLISPILGALVTIISSLLIGVVFILRQEKKGEAISESSDSFEPHSEIKDLVEDAGINNSESVRVRVLDANTLTPNSKTSVTQLMKEGKSETEADKLQKRIAQLEKQIKSLKEQLAEEPFVEPVIDRTPPDSVAPTKAELEGGDKELTVVAIQRLLEALDEKFAKRAISEQLYTRLRDKYLARLEKAERRSETSSHRGTKKTRTGDH